MFLQSVQDKGFKGIDKIRRDIDHIQKNPLFATFLEDITMHLQQSVAVTTYELEFYNELEKSGQVLELQDLLETVREEEYQRNALQHRKQFLQKQLSACRKRITLMQQQFDCLESTYNDAIAYENQLQELEKLSLSNLSQNQENHKTALKEYTGNIEQIHQQCNAISSCFEGGINKQSLLSHIDLKNFLASEDLFTTQLTQLAKSQFKDVSMLADDLTSFSGRIHTAVDTILLGDAEEEVKNKLLTDLKRATLGYPSRQKRVILAKANLERSVAVNNYLKNERSMRMSSGIGVTESYLASLNATVENIIDQSSYLLKNLLPSLLSKRAPELKNLVLTDDCKRKITKQREIKSKQKKIIDLLSMQCSRLSLLWMLLQLERIHPNIFSKKLTSLNQLLSEELKIIYNYVLTLNAAIPAENLKSERKAVIDKRDLVMLNLYDLLVFSSSGSMFKTFEAVQKAASELVAKPNIVNESLRERLSLSLRDSVREFYWKFSSVDADDGRLMLSDPEFSKPLEKLQNSVSEAKVSFSNLLKTVDNKRAYIAHNDDAAYSRVLWIDFVLKALDQC